MPMGKGEKSVSASEQIWLLLLRRDCQRVPLVFVVGLSVQ